MQEKCALGGVLARKGVRMTEQVVNISINIETLSCTVSVAAFLYCFLKLRK